MSSELYRAERIFENAQRLRERFVMPTKVVHWMQENYDELMQLYSLCREFCENTSSLILDRSDFHTFCACIARLSTVDFRGYDDRLVWDYLPTKQTDPAPVHQTESLLEQGTKSTPDTQSEASVAARSS